MCWGSIAETTDYLIKESALGGLQFNELLLLSLLYNANLSLVPETTFWTFVLVDLSK
jgi:hypothetical protein